MSVSMCSGIRLATICFVAVHFMIFLAQHAHGKLTIEAPAVEIQEKIKNNEFLVVIFRDPEDQDIIEFTAEQFKGAIDGFPGIEAIVTSDEHVATLNGVTEFPTVAFFRHGIPIFHEDEEFETLETPEWMAKHREPHVKRLTDSNFEHDTQATTGATTGDWFVMFYNQECPHLLVLAEYMAIELSQVKVIGVVDTGSNPELAERFKQFTECPALVMFSHGKMYEYTEVEVAYDTMVDFARDGFKNAKALSIPELPGSPGVGNIAAAVIGTLGTALGIIPLIIVGVLIILIVVIVIIKRKRKQRSKFD